MAANDALIEALAKAVEAAPDNAALRKHLADLLIAAGKVEDAIQHYRVALNHAPADQAIKLALAEAYQELGKPEVSLVIIEEILRGASPLPRDFQAGR